MKLSVIIVSYNVRPYLLQCIDSLKRAIVGIDAEICVIDNHSKDDTVECLRHRNYGIKLIASNHNNGFAKANNIAIKQTSGEYVLLLNPDTIVGEDVLKECIAFMDSHKNAGGLGVQMLKCDGDKALESRRGLPTPMTSFYKMCGLCARYPQSKRFGRYYMCGMPWDKPGRIEVISGAFFMARRAALDKAGLLDEDFFMYGEDIDLSYRLLKGGFENWYLPYAILHYKGESTQKTSFRYVHVFYQAMLIFFRKHYGHLSFCITMPIKAAVYLKALMALAKMQSYKLRKSLGFTYRRCVDPSYLCVGDKPMIARCRLIARRKGLAADFLECASIDFDALQNKVGRSIGAKSPICVVFDLDTFSFGTVLEVMSRISAPNVKLGTYSGKSKIIITPREIIK